jgi:hypothetical protein
VHIAVAGPTGAASEAMRFGSHRPRTTIQTLSVGEALDRLRRLLAACPPRAQSDDG